MGIQLPFRRNERFPALQQAKQLAEAQAQQLFTAVEQRLPRRRVSFWARPLGTALITALTAMAVVGTAIAAVKMFLKRSANAEPQTVGQELGLATSHTEVYDAHRALDDDTVGGADTVHQAATESFPASDAPVFVNGPDVPIIRHGERKEELPYQQP